MVLPRWLARANRVGANRVTRLVAGRLPGMGIVVHAGRRSGTEYRTPVNVFRRDGGVVVALTYGSGAQWVRNVRAAGGADVVVRGRTRRVVDPRVVTDPERMAVPRPVRPLLRVLGVDEFLVLDDADG
jgi:deazaflavin-dependent oxidoreductase (nitroreductase family)